MLLAYLILGSALSISITAIYFSIIGLTTLFPGAFWPIVIMGTVLEVGKLVCASWLHHNWKEAPRLLKAYLTVAVCVLIGITSMGIFGFLSKSHIEQERQIAQTNIEMSQLESKIKNENNYISRQNELIKKTEKVSSSATERTDFNIELEQKKIKDLQDSLATSIKYDHEEIARLDGRLSQLDSEVQALEASPGGLFSSKKKKIEQLKEKQRAERSLISSKKSEAEANIKSSRASSEDKIGAIRERIIEFQDGESTAPSILVGTEKYDANIKKAYENIDEWEGEKFRLHESIAHLEVEVGPIKYIAALIEDMGVENIVLAEAVRMVILILVFVFDPLAVVMLLAANMNFRQARQPLYPKLSAQIGESRVINSISAPTPTMAPTTTSTTTLAPTTTIAPTTPAPPPPRKPTKFAGGPLHHF